MAVWPLPVQAATPSMNTFTLGDFDMNPFRFLLTFFVVILSITMLAGCGGAERQKLEAEIAAIAKPLEAEVLKLEADQTYLAREAKEVAEKNKALTKRLGQQDSVYNALTKAFMRLADEHQASVENFSKAADEVGLLSEKIKDPSFSTTLIAEDFEKYTDEKFFSSLKQKANATLEAHEPIEDGLKAREVEINAIPAAEAERIVEPVVPGTVPAAPPKPAAGKRRP